jgi:hypothetical protein
MTARECVLRFLAFTVTPPEQYRAADFDAFLSEAMANLNAMSDSERDSLGNRFLRSLRASHRIFGDAAFRKPRMKNRLPVNKALFEVWTVTMDKQTDEKIELLEESSSLVVREVDQFMRNDSMFLDAVSQGTGDAGKVRIRFDRFRNAVEGLL